MSWTERLQRARGLTWSELAWRATGPARRATTAFLRRQRDNWLCTYSSLPRARMSQLATRLGDSPLELLHIDVARTEALARRAVEHRFDLLGSGLVEVKHGVGCRGLEGNRYEMGSATAADPNGDWLKGKINGPNLRAAQRRWRLIDGDYTPIDWQLDFKSGYRWRESAWYKDMVFGHLPGVDIKVPWELSRMQHLPQLAWAFALARQGHPGFLPAERYAREMRNQLLDFVATNPPRFGVNWSCTMDVGIRVANWLIAFDLARAAGARFAPDFERVFLDSVYDHGRHIARNLEWFPEGRGNHYLANVVGLLFVASHLPLNGEVKEWWEYACRELVNEVGLQFGADGGNFEGSTSYHRLSAEMVLYATALALGHREPGERPVEFPAWYVARLEKMAEFTEHCTKMDGRVVQVGDNDSGRFFKVDPAVYPAAAQMAQLDANGTLEGSDGPAYWQENHLEHRHLISGIRALYEQERGTRPGCIPNSIETVVIQRLARGAEFSSYRAPGDPPASAAVRVGTIDDWTRLSRAIEVARAEERQRYVFAVEGGGARVGLELHGYPDFGIWIYRSARIFLSIRCGPVGEKVNASHWHNDQLAVELSVDGRHDIRDPGSYLYSPLPERRNQYRSVRAHFSPCVDGEEPGRLDTGLFKVTNPAKGEALYFGVEGFAGRHRGFGAPVTRLVELRDDAVIVIDHSQRPLAELADPPPFSPGYGIQQR